MPPADLTRRTFGGAALLGVSLPLLAACGGDEPATATGDSSPSTTPEKTPSGADGSASGESLVAAADVPVGGGVVLADAEVVVTQPSDGQFKCFTAICTHMGCTVASVEDGEISCPCHGSKFSAEDGSVTNGPASKPLEEFPVSVEGDQVVRG